MDYCGKLRAGTQNRTMSSRKGRGARETRLISDQLNQNVINCLKADADFLINGKLFGVAVLHGRKAALFNSGNVALNCGLNAFLPLHEILHKFRFPVGNT